MSEHCCHKCGTPWVSEARAPGFKEICCKCGAYLHCCRNCRFHLPSAHNQCYIPDTEYVRDRAGLNFCEEFEFRAGAPGSDRQSEKKQQARDAFSGLFGDEPPPPGGASFEDLFKKE